MTFATRPCSARRTIGINSCGPLLAACLLLACKPAVSPLTALAQAAAKEKGNADALAAQRNQPQPKKDLFEVLSAEPGFTMSFAALPLKGDSAKRSWPSMHFAFREFGIARRWDRDNILGQHELDAKTPYLDPRSRKKVTPYVAFTLSEVDRMTSARLATLSPAEKLDLASGSRNFPLFRSEVQRTLNLERNHALDNWQGYNVAGCVASTVYDQPVKLVARKGTAGIPVLFRTEDIEGLLTWRTNTVLSRIERHRLGVPNRDRRISARKNEDQHIDAATFHAVLTNMFSKANKDAQGANKRWLAGDVDELYPDRSRTIWGFESTPLSEADAKKLAVEAKLDPADIARDPNDPGSRIACLKTRLFLSLESSTSLAQHDPVPRDWQDVGPRWELSYCLRLNGKGDISEGLWLTRFGLVDTLWSFGRPPPFGPDEALLEGLYKSSIQDGGAH